MRTKEIKCNIIRFIGNYLLYSIISVLCKTLRITYKNKEVIDNLTIEKKNYVLAFWHGTMLLPWYIHKNSGFSALISKSKDGDILANVLKRWKYKVVRGSSSKDGEIALGIMIDYAKNNYSVAVTPDGPRGPVHKMKAGAVVTAKKSGIPVILTGVGIKRKRILKSWDGFQIPKIFSKVNIFYSLPIYIDKNFKYDDTSNMILKCETELNELQKNAEMFIS